MHAPAVIPGSQSIKLYENLTCIPHAAYDYRIKLQHQEYMERRTAENNIYIEVESYIITLGCSYILLDCKDIGTQ